MKKLNGRLYFETKDVLNVIDNLLFSLNEKEFICKQSAKDRTLIENAINKFKNELLFVLTTEFAVKFDLIETIYTQTMYPASNILSPEMYNQIPYHDITQIDMKNVENWFFNYGLSLAIAEFEKI